MSTDDDAPTAELLPLAEPEADPAFGSATTGTGDLTGPAGPRVRWAGIVWGLALAAVAAFGFWLTGAPGGVDELVAAAPTLTPTGLLSVIPLTLGALALVTGVAGLLRGAQRRAARRRATASTTD